MTSGWLKKSSQTSTEIFTIGQLAFPNGKYDPPIGKQLLPLP